jgi:hypothetical protein
LYNSAAALRAHIPHSYLATVPPFQTTTRLAPANPSVQDRKGPSLHPISPCLVFLGSRGHDSSKKIRARALSSLPYVPCRQTPRSRSYPDRTQGQQQHLGGPPPCKPGFKVSRFRVYYLAAANLEKAATTLNTTTQNLKAATPRNRVYGSSSSVN